jgi:porin
LSGLRRGETTVELTYRFPAASGFMVQPNVQYVANPSGDPRLADALVAGVRLHAAFGAP